MGLNIQAEVNQNEEELKELYRKGVNTADILKVRSTFYDKLIEDLLYNPCLPVKLDEICIIGTGSYGRQEMNRHSDLDLQILHQGLPISTFDEIDKIFVAPLWENGVEISIMNRDISSPITSWDFNLHERTVFFETRYICGNKALYNAWHSLLEKYWAEDGNRKRLLEELIKDYENHVNSFKPRESEPNIKTGLGGIREYTFLFFIARVTGKEIKDLLTQDEETHLKSCLNFLWLLRDILHFLTGKYQDVLTHELQVKISSLMKFTEGSKEPESKLLRLYNDSAEEIHRIAGKAISSSQK